MPRKPRFSTKGTTKRGSNIPCLVWLPHKDSWYFRMRTPEWLLPALPVEIKRSLNGVGELDLPVVATILTRNVKLAIMEIDKIRLLGKPYQELAQLYVNRALTLEQHALVQGYVYGGEGAGVLRDVLQAEIEHVQKTRDHAATAPAQETPKARVEAVPAGLSLSEAGQAYCEAHKAEWAEKTTVSAQGTIDDLVFVFGTGRSVNSITHRDLLSFRDTLGKLPPSRTKLPEYKGKTCEQLLALKVERVYSPTTMVKRMGWVISFFKWLEKHEFLSGKNPAHDLKPKIKRGSVEARQAFTAEDISVIKSDILTSKQKKKDIEKYWITYLGIYSGARIGELAGLRKEDITMTDGIPCISISDTEDRQLKTDSSIRTIPIHPEIIKAGFVDWVDEQKDGRLFDINSLNATSKWFNRHVQELLPNRKVMYHCLRHTVVATLQQAGVSLEVIAAIVGHEQKSITLSVYGKGYKPSQLLEALQKLPY